ncbi:MAG: class I SAM-dependent methyltransferase [Aggregatilineales bacterium]
MAIVYEDIKPWGRLLGEYVGMFALTEADFHKRILGCSDGPASFNAEMTAQGYRVTSVDPLYAMSAAQIEQRVQETWQEILAQVRDNMEMFVWTKFKTPDELGEARLSAMRQFIADYETGKAEERYLEGSLPQLPFEDHQFELALCSNFLFLYDEHFTDDFHIEAVRELCRVADEVRIFPLHGLQNTLAKQVAPVEAALRADGWQVERVVVDYEFRHGSNRMLRLTR